jgi:D-glycero-alpha-D-manno-heptose 1-phosphate guanylyltransferase
LEAVILAGGLGTRLQSVVSEVPKSMAPVNGKPFLEYQLDYLSNFGIKKFIFSVGYKAEIIQKHFGDQWHSIPVDYAFEKEPLGTGGGIKNAMKLAESEQVLVLNGDTLFRINLNDFLDFHLQKESAFSLALRKVNDVSRYGTVCTDENGMITGFKEKNTSSGEGFINGGIYLIEKNIFFSLPLPARFSIEKDFFEKYYQALAIFAMPFEAYFLDIGIPEDYQRAQNEFTQFTDKQ